MQLDSWRLYSWGRCMPATTELTGTSKHSAHVGSRYYVRWWETCTLSETKDEGFHMWPGSLLYFLLHEAGSARINHICSEEESLMSELIKGKKKHHFRNKDLKIQIVSWLKAKETRDEQNKTLCYEFVPLIIFLHWQRTWNQEFIIQCTWVTGTVMASEPGGGVLCVQQ